MSVACIIPTVVPAASEDIVAARKRYLFAQALHIDVADGVFAQNKTWTPPPGYKLPEHAVVLYEVHLMAEQPLALGLAYAHAGARRLIAHIESFRHADAAQDVFTMWRGAGVNEIGAAILLDTQPKELVPYTELVDFIHVMTIREVGMQGKPFESVALDRIARLHTQYPQLIISVDGGVSQAVIPPLRAAGVSRYCVGAALADCADPENAFTVLCALCTTEC